VWGAAEVSLIDEADDDFARGIDLVAEALE